MLALLLIGMSTLAFSVQPINSDLKTLKNRNKKGNIEQARIVEHKISSFELDELKRKLGVREEGRNYNQIIDGHGTGLRPPTDNEWAEIADNAYIVERILLDPPIQAPSSVDHTTKQSFPPIGDQSVEGSCTTWAVGYYTKTFQEAEEHGWDLSGAEWLGSYPTPAYQDQIFSPDFIYHLINGGVDYGSSFPDAINLVCSIGSSSWEKMPNNPVDHSSWPSEEAWREAPLYRGNSSGLEYLELNTDDDITSLKNWISSDHLAVIAVDADKFSSLTSKDVWTLNNYVNPEVNHANTIVGYDDNIMYIEGGVRYGAFKIANSWGVGGWENVPDGCYWISYEAMKQRVEWCVFYRDRIGYDPKLLASFEIDYSERGECDVLIGMGNHSDPLAAKSFSDLIDGGDFPFCSNNIVLDITEFEDAVPTVTNQSFFMRVRAGIPAPHSGTYEWYSDGVEYSWFRLNQTFDIPETGATLNFWSYYEIEEDWDYGYVEVHDLDTDEWYTLPGLMTVSTLPEPQDNPNCPLQFEPTTYYSAGRWNAFTGFSGDQYEEEMDLTSFANHTIELYFTYWTDPYVLELGWYVDDIGIPEIGFFDDVESGPNGWTYNGWYITTPPSPINGTLLSFSIEYYDSYSSGSLNAKSTSYDVPLNITNRCAFACAYMHNIEIANITTSKTVIGQGFTTNITVTVVNEGAFTETFNVTFKADATEIGKEETTLTNDTATDLTFTWNTTGFDYGNYNISAYATPVLNETRTSDNTYTDGTVLVSIQGDVNGDYVVDVSDLFNLGKAYGNTSVSSNWTPNCDLNNDNEVDDTDLLDLIKNYGKST